MSECIEHLPLYVHYMLIIISFAVTLFLIMYINPTPNTVTNRLMIVKIFYV